MPHRDAVVDADGVELERNSAGLAYRLLHHATELLQVNVAGNDVDVRVAHRDERLVEITAVADLTGRAQQTAVRCALEPFLDGVGAHHGRSVVYGGMECIKKVKGLVPSLRERPFISVAERLSRLREEGVCLLTSLLSEQSSSQSQIVPLQ